MNCKRCCSEMEELIGNDFLHDSTDTLEVYKMYYCNNCGRITIERKTYDLSSVKPIIKSYDTDLADMADSEFNQTPIFEGVESKS